ncbi:unnamed protein product [Clavelina lepadiformis]|uniref:carbonyl reductase (NADPH) n=1 Tax=Clavelina lepadiformis TaxID=159417 RepID=A0ABP0FH25_CLALP
MTIFVSSSVQVVSGNNCIRFAVSCDLCKKFDGDVYLTARNDDRCKEAVKLIEGEGLKITMSSTKVAVVSGGNKGIGLAIVRALCKKFDGDVYLTSRDSGRGQEGLKQIQSEGLGKVKYHQLDIDDVGSITKLKDDMLAGYGGIDVLINNAGIAYKVEDTAPFSEQAKVTVKTNFFGTLQASKILLPIIKPKGRVVNVSSMLSPMTLKKCSPDLQAVFRSGTITENQLIDKMNEFVQYAQEGTHQQHGYPDTSYGMSKIGVTVMSRIHARWLREQGKNDILLNACCPGWVRTDMAGPKAPKSPDEGAETPVYLALLPEGATEPHGQFVSDKKVQEW